VLGYAILTGSNVLGGLGRIFERLNPANKYYHDKMSSLSKSTSSGAKSRFSLYGFGLSYGAASHTCTLPIFLGIVLIPLASGAYWLAASTVFVYGASIAALFVLMITLGRSTISGFYRRILGRYLQYGTGALFLISGIYLLIYFIQNYGGFI
jgi:cytochrome c-type biogenesis protein